MVRATARLAQPESRSGGFDTGTIGEPSEMMSDDIPVPEKMLSPFEWTLMETAWSLGEEAPLLYDVHRKLSESREINYNSVNSLLKRVEKKGWVFMDRSQNRRHRCRPLFTREQVIEIEIEHFLSHLQTIAPGGGLAMLRERLAALPGHPTSTG